MSGSLQPEGGTIACWPTRKIKVIRLNYNVGVITSMGSVEFHRGSIWVEYTRVRGGIKYLNEEESRKSTDDTLNSSNHNNTK